MLLHSARQTIGAASASRVADDYDNVRAAIDFGIEREPELAARLVGGITFFVWLRGGFAEAAPWVDACLARADALAPELLTRVHECGSCVWLRLGDVEKASRHADDVFTVADRTGDAWNAAIALNIPRCSHANSSWGGGFRSWRPPNWH